VPVNMPLFGPTMEMGTVERWLKTPGDPVRRGEAIAEIFTDKVTMEMEAMVSGTLIEILQPDGAEVPVGSPIAIIEDGS
jgi:pyruvate dehydrogenase E2 component (dihydrolipoamide acetyltransferase)